MYTCIYIYKYAYIHICTLNLLEFVYSTVPVPTNSPPFMLRLVSKAAA